MISRLRALGSPLCVGIDPHLDRVPTLFGPRGTAQAVEAFGCAIVERAAGRVAVVKPQIAFFEQLGWQGIRALDTIVKRAREAGLLVLLDAKRGDIGSTAEGYVAAYLAADAPIEVDAITLSPYLGLDTLEPFAAAAEANGRGLVVLSRTSNPGSGDLQDLAVEGTAVYERVAASLAPLCERLRGPDTGWSSLGVVVGATWPEQHEAVRKQLPNAFFLVPGYGAQGGGARDAVRGFVPGPSGLEGGVVSSSRAVLFPEAAATDDLRRWERAIDDALARSIDALADAVQTG